MFKKIDENLSGLPTYTPMKKEIFGIWTLKRDRDQFFVVNGGNWHAIGLFDRHVVSRVYAKENSVFRWENEGMSDGYGFRNPNHFHLDVQKSSTLNLRRCFPSLRVMNGYLNI